jgi:hypothetical protein
MVVEQIDWQVVVRVLVHRHRRYQRRCPCDGAEDGDGARAAEGDR